MLELAEAGKSFKGKRVIESVTLSLAAGEILCLTGPSGIGKTTLLEIMAGVTQPDRGTVRRTEKAALMFQDDVLVPWFTAQAAITYILPSTLSGDERKNRAAFWLDKFGLDPKLYPAAMSGGMRRRLSIARTFAADRRLVLLDEPFAFLDPDHCRQIAKTMAEHARAGCGIILTSHVSAPLMDPCFAHLPLRTVEISNAPVVIRR